MAQSDPHRRHYTGIAMHKGTHTVGRVFRAVPMLAVLLCCVSPALAAEAATYPERPVRFLVPYPPGGANDILGRLVGQYLSSVWDHPVIVDNRPGGNTTIATDLTAKATPDGHTLLVTSSAHSVLPSLYSKLPFDVMRDFSTVALIATGWAALVVHPSVPAHSVKELIGWAKSKPGQINYASTGFGGSGHLAMELLKHKAGLDLTHVPYKGATPALTDVVAGRVPLMFANIVPALPHVKSGRLRALAVTSPRRVQTLPDLPTVAESGVPGFDVTVWLGLLGPARMPPAIVSKVNAQTSKIVALPEVRERLVALGFDPATATPAQFRTIIAAEVDKWAALAKAANIRLE